MLGDVSCLCKAVLQGQRGSLTGQSWWPRGGSHKPGKPGQRACWHFSFLISHKYFSFNRASVQMKRNFFVSLFCYIIFENSYQPPNYPFEDRLAKNYFSPPSYPPFYKQKGTLVLVLFPLGKWNPYPFLPETALLFGLWSLVIPGVVVQSSLPTAQPWWCAGKQIRSQTFKLKNNNNKKHGQLLQTWMTYSKKRTDILHKDK